MHNARPPGERQHVGQKHKPSYDPFCKARHQGTASHTEDLLLKSASEDT